MTYDALACNAKHMQPDTDPGGSKHTWHNNNNNYTA
jgi:hypothetical protein